MPQSSGIDGLAIHKPLTGVFVNLHLLSKSPWNKCKPKTEKKTSKKQIWKSISLIEYNVRVNAKAISRIAL